jgi:hypothetical protein
MAYMSYRYERHDLRLPPPTDAWEPIGTEDEISVEPCHAPPPAEELHRARRRPGLDGQVWAVTIQAAAPTRTPTPSS